MAINVEAEIRDLKRRVGELEGSFGFMTRQIKDVHNDLLGFQAATDENFEKIDGRFEKIDDRFEKMDGRFQKIDGRFDKMDARLDRLEADNRRLRQELPGIVGNAMREVLRERPAKGGKASD